MVSSGSNRKEQFCIRNLFKIYQSILVGYIKNASKVFIIGVHKKISRLNKNRRDAYSNNKWNQTAKFTSSIRPAINTLNCISDAKKLDIAVCFVGFFSNCTLLIIK